MLQSVGAPLRHLVDEDNSSDENAVILLGQKWSEQKTEINKYFDFPRQTL